MLKFQNLGYYCSRNLSFVKTTQQIALGILVTVGCNVVQPLENIESISHKDNPVAIADMPTKVHSALSNVLK